jgi:ankyrin repeat protein/mono/diheme cytochrome c family protein
VADILWSQLRVMAGYLCDERMAIQLRGLCRKERDMMAGCRAAMHTCVWVCLVALSLPAVVHGADSWQHPLFRAIEFGDTALLASLLRQGAPVNLRRADGTTPLMHAALRGDSEQVRLLLEHGADARAASQRGVTALLWGAGDQKKVELLLRHGADINARSALGNTPLMAAAARPGGHLVVAMMLDHGANPSVQNRRHIGPLQNALIAADADTVALLLEHDPIVAWPDDRFAEEFAELVSLASESGNEATLEHLIEWARRRKGELPVHGSFGLHKALLAQHPTIACRLIELGAKLDVPTSEGRVPAVMLATYTETGDTSVLQRMLQRGADVAVTNDQHETALTWARRRGHSELIDLLVSAGTPEALDSLPTLPARSLNLHAGNHQSLVRQAIQKSLKLMQSSSDTFLKERATCVSCHHQNLPGVALGWARDRGFDVDELSIQRMIDRQRNDWRQRTERAYQLDVPGPVAERFFGYGLWSFAELGFSDRDVIEPFVFYLAATQQPDGRWISGMMRPPMGEGDVLATLLAMRSLQLYPLASQADECAERVERAAAWLARTEPRYHQERVLRLLGLAWAGWAPSELSEPIDGLLASQHDDGGWSQLTDLASDAWATGQTMVALRAAGVPASHSAYQRAVEYLLRTQFDDGSWFVKSRTWPFQAPFDSGFPHGRDQWVSIGGSAWAVMGLLLSCEPDSAVQVHEGPSPDRAKSTPQAIARGTEPGLAADAANVADVDFAAQIKPILERSCASCHGGEKPASGFRVSDRPSLLSGGDSDLEAIVAGDSSASRLLRFVADQEPGMQMPPPDRREEFPALSSQEQAVLRAWIDQGAVWP